MMTVKLELRCAHLTAEKDAVILKLVRILAKQLLAQASLLQDLSTPEIRIECGDFFSTSQEVKLFDDDGAEFDTGVVDAIDRFSHSNEIHRLRVNVRPEDMEDPA